MEEVNSLVAELVKVISKERALLEQCKDFLSMLAAMQVHLAIRFIVNKNEVHFIENSNLALFH